MQNKPPSSIADVKKWKSENNLFVKTTSLQYGRITRPTCLYGLWHSILKKTKQYEIDSKMSKL
ncbi:MAG: hypothetical protein HKM23_03230 [Nitrosopumilus sp.]|nr:hypothetical protein [Nitrosopumilus sp.]